VWKMMKMMIIVDKDPNNKKKSESFMKSHKF
jgi:hypothetical protein